MLEKVIAALRKRRKKKRSIHPLPLKLSSPPAPLLATLPEWDSVEGLIKPIDLISPRKSARTNVSWERGHPFQVAGQNKTAMLFRVILPANP